MRKVPLMTIVEAQTKQAKKVRPPKHSWRHRRLAIIGSATALGLTTVALAIGGLWGPSSGTLAEGRELFEHEWQPGDSLAAEGDGLGPVFNANSCAACHFQAGIGGGGTNEHNVTAFDVHPVKGRPEVRGGVVHAAATHPDLLETQQRVRELFPIVKGGSRVVRGCSVKFPDFDPVSIARINTPALFGAGLIDELSETRIVLKSQWRALDLIGEEFNLKFDGTSVGRARFLPDGRIGKFGWKGQFATLEEFVAAACAVEMGLTNPLRQQDQPREHVPDPDAKLDLDEGQFYALVSFVESLPRPEQILPTHPLDLRQVHEGEALFSSVGCSDCHTPDIAGIEGIFSDFMLHRIEDPDKIGSGYGPSVEPEVPLPAHHPLPDEWKTPPLWGVADSAPYFHDGGSPTLEHAITRHHGQAKGVTENYERLSEQDQQALVAFLKTLKAPQQQPMKKGGDDTVAVAEVETP